MVCTWEISAVPASFDRRDKRSTKESMTAAALTRWIVLTDDAWRNPAGRDRILS
jgi:hypothetical protein